MNRTRAQTIAVILALGAAYAYGGDFAALPKDEAGFREKVNTFIRPGARAADARRLLESDRFHCEERKDAKGAFLWCSRLDGSPMASVRQRYQVVMRTVGSSVTSVETSTGLVGL
jgi:hypothetical protein